MALQGTIDTFPVTDVLSLLGSSATTGRLTVQGDRGRAEIWVRAGELVGGTADDRPAGDAAGLVFELLRFAEGDFEFTAVPADELPDSELESAELATAVVAAQELRAEWAEIEAVVPSTAHRVGLVAELPEEELVVDPFLWSVIVAAGATPSVDELADRLGLGEFAACAAVASLVGRGLATVEEPAAPTTAITVVGADLVVADAADTAVGPPRSDVVTEETERRHGFPDRFPIDDLIGDDTMEQEDPWSSPEMEQLEAQRRADAESAEQVSFASMPPPLESVPFGETEPAEERWASAEQDEEVEDPVRSTAAAWDDMVDAGADPVAPPVGRTEEDTADEVLRQMSKLSPKAAEAIAAALSTVPAPSGDEDRRDDDSDDGGDGGPVSFLGSF
ncbi:MAG: DUF4388 domain-containing protein [Microthrixaceae bacterium]